MFDGGEFGIHPHAFVANPFGHFSHTLTSELLFDVLVHPFDCPANVFGSQKMQAFGTLVAGF
jgi:hypothetical protein